MDIEETLSIQQNNSLPLEYEQCLHCSRSFFKGKLKYHLKLCTQQNPMVISPKKSSREPSGRLANHDKNYLLSREEKKPEKYNESFPAQLCEKQGQYGGRQQKAKAFEKEAKLTKKSSTDVNFKQKEENKLPLIKLPSLNRPRLLIIKQPYQVKLREELSCFRRAQEIKQIQCPACERTFSKQASLRHVPICQALKKNQKMSIALKKRTKINKSLCQNILNLKNMGRREGAQRQLNKRQQANPEVNADEN